MKHDQFENMLVPLTISCFFFKSWKLSSMIDTATSTGHMIAKSFFPSMLLAIHGFHKYQTLEFDKGSHSSGIIC